MIGEDRLIFEATGNPPVAHAAPPRSPRPHLGSPGAAGQGTGRGSAQARLPARRASVEASNDESGRYDMPTTTGLAWPRPDVNGTRCDALFASGLQPSDAPTAEMVVQAIRRAVRQFGPHGCAARMAQEFGDHPDTAASRMRWVRQIALT
jgi:hypothetical protein